MFELFLSFYFTILIIGKLNFSLFLFFLVLYSAKSNNGSVFSFLLNLFFCSTFFYFSILIIKNCKLRRKVVRNFVLGRHAFDICTDALGRMLAGPLYYEISVRRRNDLTSNRNDTLEWIVNRVLDWKSVAP